LTERGEKYPRPGDKLRLLERGSGGRSLKIAAIRTHAHSRARKEGSLRRT